MLSVSIVYQRFLFYHYLFTLKTEKALDFCALHHLAGKNFSHCKRIHNLAIQSEYQHSKPYYPKAYIHHLQSRLQCGWCLFPLLFGATLEICGHTHFESFQIVDLKTNWMLDHFACVNESLVGARFQHNIIKGFWSIFASVCFPCFLYKCPKPVGQFTGRPVPIMLA